MLFKSQKHPAILIYHWLSPCVCNHVVSVQWGFLLPMLEFMLVPALIHLLTTCSPSQPPLQQLYTAGISVCALGWESGFLYWILSVCVCMLLHMHICVPYMPLLRGIRATPNLRYSTLNTRLIKLPHGVAWPSCPYRSFNICHNNNGSQVASHSIIVPLNYLQSILLKRWLSYAQQCYRVSMSSLMKLSLSGSIPRHTSQG